MFQVGEYIIYGSTGVCQVTQIAPMTMTGAQKGKLYYTLLPVYSESSKVFTPVDNDKIIMRKVMTKEEAQEGIARIPEIEPLWIADEKRREQLYKELIFSCSFDNLIKIIKTLYLRKKARIEGGKKITAVDERYFKMAEDSLYGELAISLQMKKDEVGQYIADCIEKTK